MKRYLAPLLAALLTACSLLGSSLPGQARENTWKLVIRVQGTVQSQLQGSNTWIRIIQSRLLSDGDRARTLEDSRGEVRLGDGSVVAIGPSTTVAMEQFRFTSEERTVKLRLDAGRLRAWASRVLGRESTFQVETPNAVLAARGTDFFVYHGPAEPGGSQAREALPGAHAWTGELLAQGGDQTLVSVNSGQVDATIGGQTVHLGPGDTLGVRPDGSFQINPPTFRPPDVPRYSGDDPRLHRKHAPPRRPQGPLTNSQGSPGTARGPRGKRPAPGDTGGGEPVLVNPTSQTGGSLELNVDLSNFQSSP